VPVRNVVQLHHVAAGAAGNPQVEERADGDHAEAGPEAEVQPLRADQRAEAQALDRGADQRKRVERGDEPGDTEQLTE
jgi:hypothetical protein